MSKSIKMWEVGISKRNHVTVIPTQEIGVGNVFMIRVVDRPWSFTRQLVECVKDPTSAVHSNRFKKECNNISTQHASGSI